MHPILVDFGWHDVPLLGRSHLYLGTYGVLFATAVLLAWIVWLRIAKSRGFDPTRLLDLGFYTLLAGLLGSKVGLILADPAVYLASPAALLSTLRAAGVLLFGVLAAVATIVVYIRRHGIPFWPLADTMAPALALGQAIGRLGCLMAGCCYGRRAVGLPWGIRFTDPAAEILSGTPLWDPHDRVRVLNVLHPVQVYQAVADFGLFLVLLVLVRRRSFPGRAALAYIGLYSVSRFIMELFRGDAERGLYTLPGSGLTLSTSQLLCVGGFAFAIVATPLVKRRAERTARAGR